MMSCFVGRVRSFALAAAPWSMAISSAQVDAGQSAFFCQGTPGEGHYLAFAAVREIPDGDLQFAISKWRTDGQHFGSDGIAQRAGDVWIYKERHRQSYMNMDDSKFYHADMKPGEPPTCKITIRWNQERHLRFKIDDTADCADSAGFGFHDKSTEFGLDDFVGPVKGELDDTDKFYNGRRCHKPKPKQH